jgi:DNA-binding response OmpR family regulator
MGKPPLILVVEDDAILRSLWRIALKLEAFDVREAGDGIDALRMLAEQRPDLVVLDLGLPLLSGVSVCQEIAAQTLTRQIPVVIVTASTEDLSSLDLSCILRKPITELGGLMRRNGTKGCTQYTWRTVEA